MPKPLSSQFQQLPMFMEAQEIRSSIQGTADYPNHPVDDVMKHKKSEADRSGLTESIRTDGVQQPVQLVHKRDDEGYGDTSTTIMGHGHHRVAAASDISKETGQPKYVPVVHSEYDHNAPFPSHATAIYRALGEMENHWPGATR